MTAGGPHDAPGDRFAVTYEGSTATINGARQGVGEWMAAHGCVEADIEVAQLVVSELVSNAIEASAPEPYHVAASWAGQRLQLAVSSLADAVLIPDPAQWGPESVLAPRGRGLAIVQALVDDVSVTDEDGRATVTVLLSVTSGD
ncbi:MAG: ATP-binding protein [Acidimicrobiales bacterium]|nr:ATP-binding protein [Acidimicrobiales bacterium]